MKSRMHFSVFLLATAVFCVPASWAGDDALEAARREYALHFFSVDAHVALAKQQFDHGDKLQAFYTLETARREHFEQQDFTRSFRRIFLGDTFDNSPKAEAALQAKVNASPTDFDSLTKLADIYISREDWTRAIPLLERASKLRPDDFSPVAALGEVYTHMERYKEWKSVIAAWTKDHPESLDAYHVRIDDLLNQDNSMAAGPVVDEALKKYPDDAALHFDLGIVKERSGDIADTQREFEKAVQLGPKVAHIQGWAARFYWIRKIDMRRALDLYLNAYFLDPDFYDSEYAEERIQRLSRQVADSLKERARGEDIPPDLLPLLPAMEKLVLKLASESWTANSAQKLLRIMGSEDEVNRATAMKILADHGDASLDQKISPLLEDPDLRKRGMAGYLAVQWRKEKAFPLMKK